jgi:hypothetical protein
MVKSEFVFAYGPAVSGGVKSATKVMCGFCGTLRRTNDIEIDPYRFL